MAVPPNDDISGARTVSRGTFTANTRDAGVSVGEDLRAETNAPVGATVWYSYTATSTGAVTFNTNGSNFDTTLQAFRLTNPTGSASYSNLTEIASNDDNGAGGNQNNLAFFASTVGFTATSGQTYYIQAGGRGDEVGGFDIGDLTLNVLVPRSANLVDQEYYYGRYPDVAAIGTDATTHYNQFGAAEGRDPNAFFSTTGYLAANPDVRAAGVNPLTHYDANGFREGRDPGANFDNEFYYAANPDVRAAGIDPLRHYLAFGQAEGRAISEAVGRSSDVGAGRGFDAEYYLLNNSDVARAAISAGGDSFAFARNHYNNFGVAEGRDPNAIFDTDGYLAAYADVRASGINPLTHYDQFGFKEGRDPSVEFDTSAYVAANADVRAAGIDPMQHYLQFGIYEGRSAFGDSTFGSGNVG